MDSNKDIPKGFWGAENDELMAHFPIHKACRDGDVITLSRLVAVATPEQITAEDNLYGWTPIHWAAYFGKSDCLNGLLNTGVNVNIRTIKYQQTPTHVAAFGGHPNCVYELIRAGADFHARDYRGELPLHKAARVGNVQCLKILIQHGAHPNICNNNGHTPGDYARNSNFKECADFLELCCSQFPAPYRPEQRKNGFHITQNGSSGCHITNGNGVSKNGFHTNGNHTSNRKRYFDDESIPKFKRARVTADDVQRCYSVEAEEKYSIHDHHTLINAEAEVTTNGDDHGTDSMDCYVSDPVFFDPETPPEESEDNYIRPPSPGMDMKLNMEDDPQLWGHLHGYGDTAESMPEDTNVLTLSEANNRNFDQTFRQTLRGIQAKGW